MHRFPKPRFNVKENDTESHASDAYTVKGSVLGGYRKGISEIISRPGEIYNSDNARHSQQLTRSNSHKPLIPINSGLEKEDVDQGDGNDSMMKFFFGPGILLKKCTER